jgi:hypothetical protein
LIGLFLIGRIVADEETDEDEKWFELVRSERGFRFAFLI